MASSGRKVGIGLLVTVLVLVGLAVLADRGAAWAAERAIAQKVSEKAAQSNIDTEQEPEVTVEGFPFLTQALAGEYQGIRIRLEQLSVEGIQISSLEVHATEVQASFSDVTSGGDIQAGHITGDATVPFSALEELVGVEGAKVSGNDGALSIRAPFETPAGKITAVARAKVSVTDGVIKIQVQKVTSDKKLPAYAQSALDSYAKQLSRKITLPKLPYDLTVESAAVGDSGVVATASANDVPLS
ncbi:MAG: LmeA family phospholipid-binding protein [Micromonosporaceae bacterium]